MKRYIVATMAVLLLHSCSNTQSQQGYTDLPAEAFAKSIDTTANAQIIDVRTPKEFERGHLKNAVNIDWNGNNFVDKVAALDKSKPVFVYCLSGSRSRSAVSKMHKLGFTNILVMPGGVLEWRANNLPLTTQNKTENMGMTVAQYQTLLHSEKLVLIDFYADWCIPCKKMKPYLEKIAVEKADQVTLVRIDADQNPDLCKAMLVTALPVLKLYKNESVIWEHTGFVSEEDLRKQLR